MSDDHPDSWLPSLRVQTVRAGYPGVEGPREDCLRVGVVLGGAMHLTIPELGRRVVNEGQWLVLADFRALSQQTVTPDLCGVFVDLPMNDLDALLRQGGCSPSCLACLICPRRDAAFFVSDRTAGRIRELAEALASDAESGLAGPLLRIAQCHELLARIFQQPTFAEEPCGRSVCCSRELDALEAVACYLENHLAEEHSLADLCRRHFINEFKLKRGFRERFHTTVFGYLRQKRMERARELLSQSDVSVLEVANEVGYTNASHFARAFRQAFGMNPRDLARQGYQTVRKLK